uniref:SOCS box domain-containing protein n=1 Tax=Salix viminalis TaxID=40686 RepID=A0A6N2LGW9_SALVM
MANPSGTHNQEGNQGPSSFNGSNPNNGNLVQEPSSGSSLKHNPGISNDWTGEEQAILDEGLAKFAMETNVVRYAKIALQLPNKTVRDVALRCRWMTKKENSKRRKEDNLMRKSKDKKERHSDPFAKTSNFMVTCPNVTPFATPMMPLDSDESISYDAIGGAIGELLKQNAQTFHQISANLASYQIQENLSLLHQTRNNIRKVMNGMDDVPQLMKQMPPLPVKLNDDLADTILQPPNRPRQ